MKYQKAINLLDNASNQPSKYRTKNRAEINDVCNRTYNANSQIKFKTAMLKLVLCNYGVAQIPVTGTITIRKAGGEAAARQADERNKGVTFKNCAPFTDCISEINNTQIDYVQNLDVVMHMYDFVEHSSNYLKISICLCKYYRDEPNATSPNSESFKSK